MGLSLTSGSIVSALCLCTAPAGCLCSPPCQWVFEGSGWVGWGGGRDRVTESERVRRRVILIRMEAGRGRSFSCFFSGLSPISPFYLLGECSSFFLCHFCLPHPRVQPILPSHFSVFCFVLFRLSILKYHPFSPRVLYPPFFLSYFCFSLPLSHPAL